MVEPMDVMTTCRMAFAMDPTGAPYAIWQPGDHKGVRVYNEPALPSEVQAPAARVFQSPAEQGGRALFVGQHRLWEDGQHGLAC